MSFRDNIRISVIVYRRMAKREWDIDKTRKGLSMALFYFGNKYYKRDCIKIFNTVKFTKERMKSEEYNFPII